MKAQPPCVWWFAFKSLPSLAPAMFIKYVICVRCEGKRSRETPTPPKKNKPKNPKWGKGGEQNDPRKYMVFALLSNKLHLSFLAEAWAKANTEENTIENTLMFQPLIWSVCHHPFLTSSSVFPVTSAYRTLPFQFLVLPDSTLPFTKCNCETFK